MCAAGTALGSLQHIQNGLMEDDFAAQGGIEYLWNKSGLRLV